MSAMRSLITRGRIVMAALNPKRVLCQLSGVAGETKTQIELLLPYGMSALPDAGDVVMLQVGGSRAHIVALGGDNPALRITDLQPGEFGFRDKNGQQVVFRRDHLEITTPLALQINVTGKTVLTCNDVELGGAGGLKIARDTDQVVNGAGAVIGTIKASETKVTAL